MINLNDYPWFYAPELPKSGEVALDPEEVRHMNAKRIKQEREGSIFKGKGLVGIGAIDTEGHVRLLETQEVPKSRFSLVIAAAVPKGERADWMFQKLTELGVSMIIPLKTEHAVVLPREAKQERWRRILIEACKQSKQAWLPELTPLSTIEQALKREAKLKLLLDSAGKPLKDILQSMPKSVLAFIGPEGGFTDEEKALLQRAECIPVSLGEQVLRIETAAMALAAAHNLFK